MGWNIDPRAITNEVRRRHLIICKRAALEIGNRLVLATPVKSGRARSNWLLNYTVPLRYVVEPTTAEQAIAEMVKAIDRAEAVPLFYIVNNLPYIERLNEGTSKMAPAGFVDSAIDGVTMTLIAAGFLKRR